MNGKTKLYVFAKKEIALIFVFMILIAVISFVLGVRFGKSYSYDSAGLTMEDRQRVDLMSDQEEQVEEVVERMEAKRAQVTDKNKAIIDSTHKRLEEEFERLDQQVNDQERKQEVLKEPVKMEVAPTEKKILETPVKAPKATKTVEKSDKYAGKFTVQLGSHRSLEEAEKFADGFRIRGYNPIINEVVIEGRGTWYRVSLGVFNTVSDAKDYILKEKSLFRGTDYVIGRFD